MKSLMLLAEVYAREITWEPAVGDPTPLAWVIVGLYAATAVCCLACLARRGRLIAGGPTRRYGLYWLLVGSAMLLLGANKQLDLQQLAHQLGRNLAIEQGWFNDRGAVMPVFIAALGVVGVLCLSLLWLLVRGLWGRVWLSGLGLAVLGAFLLLRVIYFLLDHWSLEGNLFGPLCVKDALEIAGVGLVLAGASTQVLRWKSPGLSASRGPA